VGVVRCGAVALDNVTGSRKAPIIGLNLADRPDIRELFELHSESPPGDVFTQWSLPRIGRKGYMNFAFRFDRPARKQFLFGSTLLTTAGRLRASLSLV
jgi:hypothetical protein